VGDPGEEVSDEEHRIAIVVKEQALWVSDAKRMLRQ